MKVYNVVMNNEIFKSIRKSKGYTQFELAVYLGLTPVHISRMENDHSKITKRTELAMKTLPFNDAKC